MVKHGWVLRSCMVAVFSIALAAAGCDDDGGGGGTGGGGTGGMGGGGTGGMPEAGVTADPSCGAGSEGCNDVNNFVFATAPQEVALTAAEEGATIYYTTDGNLVLVEEGAGGAGGTMTVVSENAVEYDGTPLSITQNTVLRFAAEGEDGTFTEESVEGYVLATNTVEEQWAQSGHGAITEEPWRHWDEDGEVPSRCAKCHSAEGFIEFATTGDVTMAAPLPAGLACAACHQGGLTEIDPVEFPSGLTATYTPDGGAYNASNICMACHQGRESGSSVDEDIEACATDPDQMCDADCTPMAGAGGAGGASGCDGLGFVNIHYYAAAATLFGTDVQGAYEYDGQTYAGQNTFEGTPHVGALDDCLGCHMNADSAAQSNHTFIPVVANCAGGPCHSPATATEFYELSPVLSDNYDDIQQLLTDLLTAIESYTNSELENQVVYLGAYYPYWFGSECAAACADGDDYDEACLEECRYSFDGPSLKAAYNYQTGDKDPGNYIHNGTYTKQFLYDSIQDLGGTTDVERPE